MIIFPVCWHMTCFLSEFGEFGVSLFFIQTSFTNNFVCWYEFEPELALNFRKIRQRQHSCASHKRSDDIPKCMHLCTDGY